MAPKCRVLASLSEDPGSVPMTYIRWLPTAGTPDLVVWCPLLTSCRYLHSNTHITICTPTLTHTNKILKERKFCHLLQHKSTLKT